MSTILGQQSGHHSIDPRQLRQSLRPSLGTRVDYDYSEVNIAVGGREIRIVALLVPRSKASTPALLRKMIQQGRLLRKVEYLPVVFAVLPFGRPDRRRAAR